MAKIRLTVDIDLDETDLEESARTPEELLDELEVREFEYADAALILASHDSFPGQLYVLRNPKIVKREVLE